MSRRGGIEEAEPAYHVASGQRDGQGDALNERGSGELLQRAHKVLWNVSRAQQGVRGEETDLRETNFGPGAYRSGCILAKHANAVL